MITHISLLYDGTCSGCTRAAQWFLAQKTWVSLDAISLSDTSFIHMRFPNLAISGEDFTAVARHADGSFSLHSKGDGWWLALWSLKRFRPLAEKLDALHMRPLARRAYALVASNRYWLSRLLLGEKMLTCRLDTPSAKQTESQTLTCALPSQERGSLALEK